MTEQTAPGRPSPSEASADTSAENEQECRWRFEQFRQLGFPIFEAEWLARRGVDHHAVRRVLGRGCSHEVAARIFL